MDIASLFDIEKLSYEFFLTLIIAWIVILIIDIISVFARSLKVSAICSALICIAEIAISIYAAVSQPLEGLLLVSFSFFPLLLVAACGFATIITTKIIDDEPRADVNCILSIIGALVGVGADALLIAYFYGKQTVLEVRVWAYFLVWSALLIISIAGTVLSFIFDDD